MRGGYNRINMQKNRILLIVGLAVMATFGWGCSRQTQRSQPSAATGTDAMRDVVLDGDCSKAKYQFACYLDNAMAKGDPESCALAGLDKRLDCLEAYQEIKGVPVECNVLTDATFRVQCLKSMGSVTAKNKGTPTVASGTSDILNDSGLKVEQRQ